MAIKKHNRQYDVIVFGATGYTGQLTAEHITKSLPTNLKWAVAGRTESKLQAVVDDCKQLNSDRPPPAIEIADTNDFEQIAALVQKARVFITTVGPYCKYGEKVVKACAETGTHYLDVTGEVPWVSEMIDKYESTAKSSGAIMIPQIGVESSPSDLTTWMLTSYIRKQFQAQTKDVTLSVHELKGTPSGGTLATVFTLFDVFSLKAVQRSFGPYALSPVPHEEQPQRPSLSIRHSLLGTTSVPHLGTLTTSLAGSTDAAVVERTWGLLSQIPSRKDQFYGPRFTWKQYMRTKSWLHGFLVHWGLVWGSLFLVFVPPVRWLMKKFVTQPGGGPDKEARAKESVEMWGVGTPDTDNPSNEKGFVRSWYKGSMYTLTGIFLAEAAATLLQDDVELDGGMYTPACLGQPFIDRLQHADYKFELKTIRG